MKKDFQSIARAIFCVLIIDACGGTLGGNPESVDPTTDTKRPEPALTIALTDAPVDDAQNVFIRVESVEIAQKDGGWLKIPLELDEEIDLLQLQSGKSSVLAAIETLPAGTYGQTRLILTDASPARLVDSAGVEHALKIPSGSESGLKLQTDFVKVENVPLALTIDFDLRKSIKLTGPGSKGNGNSQASNKDKYMLTPVLRLTDNSRTGSISGQGVDGSVVCVYAKGSAVEIGEDEDEEDSCPNAISSFKVKAGEFKQAFLEPGIYELKVFRNSILVGTVDDIEVKAGQDKGTIILP